MERLPNEVKSLIAEKLDIKSLSAFRQIDRTNEAFVKAEEQYLRKSIYPKLINKQLLFRSEKEFNNNDTVKQFELNKTLSHLAIFSNQKPIIMTINGRGYQREDKFFFDNLISVRMKFSRPSDFINDEFTEHYTYSKFFFEKHRHVGYAYTLIHGGEDENNLINPDLFEGLYIYFFDKKDGKKNYEISIDKERLNIKYYTHSSFDNTDINYIYFLKPELPGTTTINDFFSEFPQLDVRDDFIAENINKFIDEPRVYDIISYYILGYFFNFKRNEDGKLELDSLEQISPYAQYNLHLKDTPTNPIYIPRNKNIIIKEIYNYYLVFKNRDRKKYTLTDILIKVDGSLYSPFLNFENEYYLM